MHQYGIKQLLTKKQSLNCCMNYLPVAAAEDRITDNRFNKLLLWLNTKKYKVETSKNAAVSYFEVNGSSFECKMVQCTPYSGMKCKPCKQSYFVNIYSMSNLGSAWMCKYKCKAFLKKPVRISVLYWDKKNPKKQMNKKTHTKNPKTV